MFYFVKKYSKINGLLFFLLIAYGIINPLFYLSLNFIINEIVKFESTNGINFLPTSLIVWSVVGFLSFLLLPFVIYYFNRILAKIMFLISFQLRIRIINAIQTYGYLEFHKTGSNSFLGYMLNDVQLIEASIARQFYSLLLFISQITFSLIFSIIIDYQNFIFFGFSLASLIIFIPIPIIFKKFLNRNTKKYMKENNKFSNSVSNFLFGYQTLFFAYKLDIFCELIANTCLRMKKQEVVYEFKNNSQSIVGQTLSLVLKTSTLIAGIFLAINGYVSFGAIVAAPSFVSSIYNAASDISDTVSNYWANRKLLNKDYKSESFINDTKTKYLNLQPKTINKIELNNVNLTIDKKEIIKNFSYTFNENKKYAIIAKSGSGKSTLMRLLLGVYQDYLGSIKINGTEVKDLDLKQLYSQIGYLTNATNLFPGNIKNNICLFEEKIDETKLNLSIEKVNLKNEINLTADAEELSVGQKQRVLLARIFYANKPIIFLDEATANLDKENRKLIEQEILSWPNKTVIMISHHIDEELKKSFDEIINL